MCFVLEMTADSHNLRDLLQCMGLIRVAWKKLKVCFRSNMWKKREFRLSFDLIDRGFFFLDCVRFRRCLWQSLHRIEYMPA